MKITVLGCGALGQLWLAALSRLGHNVQGWMKLKQPYCTINIISPLGEKSLFQLPSNNIDYLAKSELLLVTLKAWQVSTAVRILLPQIKKDCIILLLHNGLGVCEELSPLIQPIVLGNTTHAAYRQNDKIHHLYAGTTLIGPGNAQANSVYMLAEILHAALPEVKWDTDIIASSWIKLAANCVINPLSVLYGCRNGQLQYYTEHVESICYEVAMVMDHEGYHINYEKLLFYVHQLISNTADNISSMLQDILAKRYSEIDYINGYLLRRAKAHGLRVPKNQFLFDMIKRKEANYNSN